MIPKLSATTELNGQGIGRLSDALSCHAVHEVNGEYELKMKYPVTGLHYEEIQNDRIIWAEPDNFTEEQAFRIYRITRPLNNVVTIYARHIAYDMSGIILNPFEASDLQTALMAIPGNCTPACPFTFETTRSVATPYKVNVPSVLWSMCGGTAGSLLDVYGGEWDFDNFTATLKTRLGTDRGFSVRYGKNMTALEQDITIESTYKAVYPFWYDEESGTIVKLDENYIEIPGAIGDRIQLVDFSGDFDEAPTKGQLRARAEAYIDRHKVGEPSISWKVSFAILGQSEEFKTILEQVALGDAVSIHYEPMNLEASSRVVKIEYDVLMERYESVTLGKVKQNLAAIVASTPAEIEKAVKTAKSSIERAIDSSTDFIKHGTGYMRFIYNSNGDLQEIVSLDNPDIAQAQKVWRWNNGGFGFSNTGYSGQYGLAITQDGAIVADYITAGTMSANRVRAGLIIDEQSKNYWNLDTGELVIREGSINITTSSATTDKIAITYGAARTLVSPSGVHIENTQFSKDVLWTREVFGGSDFGPVQGWFVCSSLATGTGAEQYIGEYGPESASITDNVNNRKIEFSPLRVRLSAGNVVRSSLENYGLLVNDSSGNNVVRLQSSGLVFRDSSDAITAQYHATPTQTTYTANNPTLSFSSGEIVVTNFGSFGFINLNLAISNPAAFASGTWYTIYTLPEGSRPKVSMNMIVPNGPGTSACLVSINTNGDVRLYRYSGSGAWSGWIYTVIPMRFI